jgi:hypothetical protein
MRARLCALLALTITTAEADDVVFWYKQGASNVELEHAKAVCEQSQLEIAIAPRSELFLSLLVRRAAPSCLTPPRLSIPDLE